MFEELRVVCRTEGIEVSLLERKRTFSIWLELVVALLGLAEGKWQDRTEWRLRLCAVIFILAMDDELGEVGH